MSSSTVFMSKTLVKKGLGVKKTNSSAMRNMKVT